MKVKLKDIFDLQMGKTPSRNNSEYWNGDYKWISIKDISNANKYIYDTKEKITAKAIEDSKIKSIPANTVIMSFKLSIGKTSITKEKIYTNEAIMAFIDKKTLPIDINYIYYLLSNWNWNIITNKAVMGLTLNKSILSNLEIDLPSIDEQKKIANILDKVTNLIELRKKQLEKLDIFSKALFVEMFGDPVENPMRWELDILSNQCQKIGSGLTPKGGKTSYVNSGVCLIRSMNVHNGFFKYKDLVHINNKQAELLKNVIVKENDVLLNITGASVARSCIVPPELLPARVNQHVSIIRLNMDKVLPIFFNNLIINSNFQKYLKHISDNNGATRQALTKQQLENLNIILPPIELQNQFAKKVEQIDKIKLSIQDSLNKLETLKKSLMQEYFS